MRGRRRCNSASAATLGLLLSSHLLKYGHASFPARLPAHTDSTRTSQHHVASQSQTTSTPSPTVNWLTDSSGNGANSSDDEGLDEIESSEVDEEEDEVVLGNGAWSPGQLHNQITSQMESAKSNSTELSTDSGRSEGEEKQSQTNSDYRRRTAAKTVQKKVIKPARVQLTSSTRASEGDHSVRDFTNDDSPMTSQPLQTLHKLQQMLDDTDYMTASTQTSRERVETAAQTQNKPSRRMEKENQEVYGKLWTSQDRRKYKQQQRQQESLRQSLHHPHTSDEDNSEDDGLGFTLPNLPIYMSDAEGESEGEQDGDASSGPPVYNETPANEHRRQAAHSLPERPIPMERVNDNGPFPQHGYVLPPQHPPQQYFHPAHYGTRPPEGYYPPPPQQYAPPYPYPSAIPPLNSLLPYTTPSSYYAAQQQAYASWAAASAAAGYPIPFQQHTQAYQQQYIQPRQDASTINQQFRAPQSLANRAAHSVEKQQRHSAPRIQTREEVKPFAVANLAFNALDRLSGMDSTSIAQPQSLVEASLKMSFASIQKISSIFVLVALASYAAVSPSTLPLSEYNLQFYDNLRLVSLALIAPAVNVVLVCDAKENDINSLVTTFSASFTLGYILAFVGEIVATTIIRLLVFSWLEPDVFELTPRVPVPVLPWVLRENRYRPTRITLFAQDFLTSCVAAPILEEYVKLRILQWTVRLPRNFNWRHRLSYGKKKSGWVADPVDRSISGQSDIVNSNQYVTHMLAASIGIKLCDAGRRILMYTKQHQGNKSLYAFCRGLFPIHELCGTMTALALAKRDLLGVRTPLWKLLGPAVVVHGMANFRGKKPIFKWNSASPWSEMQLGQWNLPDTSTLPQLLNKGFAKFMWLVILGRVLGYCIKNYYMVNRQAVKRTTTYAGKHAAFSAELATAEVLKKKT